MTESQARALYAQRLRRQAETLHRRDEAAFDRRMGEIDRSVEMWARLERRAS